MTNLESLGIGFFLFLIFDACNGQACDSILTGSGVIKSEGHPGTYPSNFDCEWTIQANDYDTVDLRFIDFNIEPGETCEFDSLDISAMGRTQKFCGDKLSNVGNNGRLILRGTVVLRMQSDGSVNLRGISLEFQVIPGVPPPTTQPPTTTPTTAPPPGTTCNDEPCQNGAECAMLSETEFICFCPDGYEGPLCEINVDDCASDPCENGGTCVDGIEEWSCECVSGYIGKTCGIDYDECRSDPCMNGGTCEDLLDAFSCTCVNGWTGTYCSEDFDDCSPNPCQNYGVCEDHLGYHFCICHPDYTGKNCDIRVVPPTTTPMPTTATTATATTTITPTTARSRKTTTMPPVIRAGQPDIPIGLAGVGGNLTHGLIPTISFLTTTPANNLGNGISTTDIEASTVYSTVTTSNREEKTTPQSFQRQIKSTEIPVSNLNITASVERNNTTGAPYSDGFKRKLGVILGVVFGAFFIGVIATFFFCNYASGLKAQQVAPDAQRTASQDRRSSRAQILSPSSADSGIAPDSEDPVLSSQNQMEYGHNISKTIAPHLSSLFSPRSSPVMSPEYLPPLRELKIIEEEGNGDSKLPLTNMPSLNYQHFNPESTVFTLSSQGAEHEPRPKRRRKIAQRSRSARPKSAALISASQFRPGSSSTGENIQKIHPFAAENLFQSPVANETSNAFQPSGILKSNASRPITAGGDIKRFNSNLFGTSEPHRKNASLCKKGSVNFHEPPLFLSELNKKPTFQFSKIDRSSARNNSDISSAWHGDGSSFDQTENEVPKTRQPGKLGGENKQKTSVLTSPTDYLPAHSIEEAFESRNPRAFEVHHRRRLAPLNLNNNQRQKSNFNQLQ